MIPDEWVEVLKPIQRQPMIPGESLYARSKRRIVETPKTEIRVCKNCGGQYRPYSVNLKRRKNLEFCGRKCQKEYTKKNTGVIANCRYCGKGYETRKINGFLLTNFCSSDCIAKFETRTLTKRCPTCGELFEIHYNIRLDNPNRKYAYPRTYCSRECFDQRGALLEKQIEHYLDEGNRDEDIAKLAGLKGTNFSRYKKKIKERRSKNMFMKDFVKLLRR